MSQHDFEILTSDANTGISFRAEVNAALQALASLSSGVGDPAKTYPFQIKVDTSQDPPVVYIRKSDNTAWVRWGYINTSGQLIVDKVGDANGFTVDSTGASDSDPVVFDITNKKLKKGSFPSGVPVGTIVQYAGSIAPSGWLICDGSAVSRTTYAALFAVIGTTYGAGDGSTTFNLPNLKGRVPVGLDIAQTEFNALGKIGGAKTHTLTVAELPHHNHSISGDGGHYHNVPARQSDYGGTALALDLVAQNPVNHPTSTAGAHSHGGATGATGSNFPHNNLQPYITLNYIIKY